MKTIRLHGELGKRFGREFCLDVRNAAEAVNALCYLVDGFRAYLYEHAKDSYKVFVGANSIREEQLNDPSSDREVIRIAPVVQGAGGNFGRIVLGIGLMWATGGLAGIGLSGFSGLAGLTGMAGLAVSVAGNIGLALVLGGIAGILAPTPKAQSLPERPANTPSYNFDGAVNTVAQGNPVPLAYGHLIVGSQVISSGLVTTQG